MNLEWLKTFKAVYEKGSATAAAASLGMSQPGVSLHLGALENFLGYLLFERRPRLLIPTEKGKFFYNRIVDPLARLEEVALSFQRGSQKNRASVTIGMCFETFQQSLEPHLPSFDFDIIFEFGEYRSLLEKLERRHVDLVITPQKIDLREVSYEAFSREQIIMVAGKGTSLSGVYPENEDEFLDWLMSQIWYGIAGDNEHFQRFWKANFGQTPTFRPNYIVPNLQSIVRILSRSQGVAIVPDFLCREAVDRKELTVLWEGKSPLVNTLYIATNKRGRKKEILQRVMDRVREEMPQLGAAD